MPNGLSTTAGPPPAPNDQADVQQQQASSPVPESLNAMAQRGKAGLDQVAQAPQQQQQQGPPAPNHAQTVATLRHMQAIETELEEIMKSPDLGKADVKSQIIDGFSRLVAERIMSPAMAVTQLSTLPDRPFDQKNWILQHYQNAQNAANVVLDHHRIAFAGDKTPPPQIDPDNHMNDIASVMQSHYGGYGTKNA